MRAMRERVDRKREGGEEEGREGEECVKEIWGGRGERDGHVMIREVCGVTALSVL